MIAETIPELQRLSPEEKLVLLGELWDELVGRPGAFPRRDDHVDLLQERLQHYRQHPQSAMDWKDVKARILASR